jgi:hypothetical protein
MKVLILVYLVNVALAAALYLDVVRTRRSGWWLIAFWVFMYAAMIAYVVTRNRARRVTAP